MIPKDLPTTGGRWHLRTSAARMNGSQAGDVAQSMADSVASPWERFVGAPWWDMVGWWEKMRELPSGNLTVCYWKWPFSSWIYPLKMVIFHSYVNLPECNDVTDVHDVLIGVLKLVIFIAMFITRGYVLNMVTPTTKTQKGCRMVILWRYMMINWTFIDEITYAILLINAGLYTVGI